LSVALHFVFGRQPYMSISAGLSTCHICSPPWPRAARQQVAYSLYYTQCAWYVTWLCGRTLRQHMDEATSAVPEGSRRPTATAAPAAQRPSVPAPALLSMGPVADTGAEPSMRRSPSPASSPSQEAFLRHKVPLCLPAYLPACLLTRPRMQSMP
jgi:hypothetical protein